MTLSGATIPSQSGPGRDGKEGYNALPEDQAILECHHQVVLCHIPGHSVVGPNTYTEMQLMYSSGYFSHTQAHTHTHIHTYIYIYR